VNDRGRGCEGEPRLGVEVIRYHSGICSGLPNFSRVLVVPHEYRR